MKRWLDLGGRVPRVGISVIITSACVAGLVLGATGCSGSKGSSGEAPVAQADTTGQPGPVSLSEAREEWRDIRASLAGLTSRPAPTATATAECEALTARAEELARAIPRAQVAKGAFDPRPGLNRAMGALRSQAAASLALVEAAARIHELQAELAEAEADLATWTRQVKVNPGVQYLVDEAEARRARASAALTRARKDSARLVARYKALAARAAEGAAAWEAI